MSLTRIWSSLHIDPYLAALVGTVALAALLPVRGAGAEAMDWAVRAAVALLFFLYGARLSPQAVLAGLMHWRLQAIIFASTFILFPAAGLLLTTLLRPWLTPELTLGIMFVCALPSTVQSSIAFTSIARGNVSAALCSASISNLLGMVLTPALMVVLLNTHGTGFSLKALADIALQLLLPFVAGQLLRPLIGAWLLRHKAITSVVDRGSILLVVYAAFSAGMVAGIWSRVSPTGLVIVLLLDMVLLALVLLVTTRVSRWCGFSTEDEIAIVFCGSKKSMAAGIPMANILFAGQALGLIVLPLMLFHQAQLFACATLARRYARRSEAAQAPDAGLEGAARPA
ncbi:bile acid:sodium symporter [Roseomonas hellenica]|uniref:Bile acid:sodium symporter n=1 Tax=Plastoroseomonas hellenica TaxID=2687306 RepID=A0ABS5EXH0_9PROT|nr:bile acid:sodium symporter family protein [Plastoroseomonas hellenica]MBR0664605.1 bile acid:sodium symporter [Plastoroseomonas hellenica]